MNINNDYDIYVIYLVRKNFQIPLVRDRGYTLDDEDKMIIEEDFSFNDFKKLYQDKAKKQNLGIKDLCKLSIKVYEKDEDRSEILPGDKTELNRKILIYYDYVDGPNYVKKNQEIFIKKLVEDGDSEYSEACLFVNQSVNNPKMEILNGLYSRLDIFKMEDTVVNPVTHALANKYRKLTKEEKQEFIQKSFDEKTKDIKNKMCKMAENDIISTYYGYNQGDVIEIIRSVQTDSISPMKMEYRVVSGIIS